MGVAAFPQIATKLSIPAVRGNRVSRDRLHSKLDLCTNYRLTLVSAPAGYGKTTLLSGWSQTTDYPVAWVSLDATDNDPLHFWSYVITALGKLEPDLGEHLLALLRAPRPILDDFLLAALVNAAATIPGDFVLVLDDYHVIQNDAVHAALATVLSCQPETMHVILAARSDPPLPLARWRARGQIQALGVRDLQFSFDETLQLLQRAMSPDLSQDVALALQRQTEGWAAGLQLAALAVQEQAGVALLRGFRGDHYYIVNYLATEVFAQQPAWLQDFLAQTSILETLEGPVCAAVTGRDDSAVVLAELLHRNFFITALNSKGAYRYHYLFADFLRDRLKSGAHGDAASLHRRAATWYARVGDLERAIRHALAAGDTGTAAAHVAAAARDYLLRGEFATLRAWFQALPEPAILARPELCVISASVLANAGHGEAAERYLGQLESLPPEDTETNLLLGEAASVRARIAVIRQDTPANIRYSEQALALLPEDAAVQRSEIFLDLGFAHSAQHAYAVARESMEQAIGVSRAAGNLRTAMLALYYLGDMELTQGRLHEAARRCQEGLAWCEALTPPSPLACWAHAGLGRLAYEWNHLDDAITHLEKAVALAQRCGEVKVLMYPRIPLAAAFQAQRRPDAAARVLDAATAVVAQSHIQVIGEQVDLARVQLWVEQGKVDAAGRWLQLQGIDLQKADLQFHELTMLAWYHLASQPVDAAALGRLRERALHEMAVATAQQRAYHAIGWGLWAARVDQTLGQLGPALDRLAALLVQAEPMGLVRTFADHGEPLAALLRQVRAQPDVARYATRVLAACEGGKAGSRSTERPRPLHVQQALHSSPHLIEPLRQRELEVLHHIAQGRSNQEIADEMVMAVSTVKWYLRNIYGKLHVNRRTQALARARELNLL